MPTRRRRLQMSVRMWSIAVLGTWLGCCVPGFSQEPGPSAKDARAMPLQPPGGGYQPLTLAQTIARTLQESGQLSRYRVNVMAQQGVVDLVGEVTDENQRAIVITLARATPGVVMVRDYLQV